ncbi:glycerol-3-phosphate acyltransferase ATS12, chloroplastic-like [Magnolia sinica]|uniref:glycerol-3-phosphate acyltransferase ATS12, chloroplastic-like n=1 Tax=Magnolia sinica TaxID=86752 RepID=UPI002659B4F8|nr:glycerol-3-phosphate acyltransferase ATS12, chloroplastic-like [Magnolia sinica]XP_058085694.1 glycerol-3-phosphate acyltransferase ATS12, chloroplastic-like [Magnolia sinica]XP_058085695.1 glycerol-3-phosphate acyltransferase ATS12, chloroplastic-like [Magnolia sinica]XP_058085696.1 glycerol-3-phosphate acyltransferase ATS12, chloroplastic-like [Magnolia sinica]
MLIFSASPSVSRSLSRARVSNLSTSSTSIYPISCSFPVRSNGKFCTCTVSLLKVRAMAELVEDKESTERGSASKRMAAIASGSGAEKEVRHSRTFLDVQSEEELLSGIRKEMESGRLPSTIAAGMEEVYRNYRNAVLQSGNPKASEIILSNMAVTFDRILVDVEEPFTFPPHHKAIREPFDYYMFGQSYIRPLIDFRKSYVGNIALFSDMEEKLQQGHNIVLISNHQSEADPAVIALLLDTRNPHLAEKLTYVAGDRVVTDPICKPFSMGRNLLCVYSKKHMHDIPELTEMKKRANTRSLKEMALLLRAGAQIIWIAPSGGRDRPDPLTGELYPAPFDASSVDNIRRLSDHSGVPGHIYPLSLLCYDIMPPPPQVEKQIGERRMISYHGVGLSVAPEMSFNEITAGIANPEEAKVVFSQSLFDSVTEQYKVLKSAIYGNQGLEASNSIISLSQPWQPSPE